MKKYLKLFVFTLFSFFVSISYSSAADLTVEEIGQEVLRQHPDATEFRIIGKYVFTSEYTLSLQDIMLGAKTIDVLDKNGKINSDDIYGEMTIYSYVGDQDRESGIISGFTKDSNLVGSSEEASTYDVSYFDYKVYGATVSPRLTKSVSDIINDVLENYKNELSISDISALVVGLKEDTTEFNIIGKYIFTSEHSITLQDLMLSARSIDVVPEDGETKDDDIYEKFSVINYVGDQNRDTGAIEGFSLGENLVGNLDASTISKYNIHYVDYENVVKINRVIFTTGEAGDSGTVEAANAEGKVNIPTGPDKANNVFIGWYTEDGTKVDENYIVNGIITAYATYLEVVNPYQIVTDNSVSESNKFVILNNDDKDGFIYSVNKNATYNDNVGGLTKIVKDIIETKEIKSFDITYGETTVSFTEDDLTDSDNAKLLSDAKIQAKLLEVANAIAGDDKTSADLTGEFVNNKTFKITVKLDETNYINTYDLTAAKPYENEYTVKFEQSEGAYVTNEEELNDALTANTSKIYVTKSFDVEDTVIIGYGVEIEGNNNVISMKEDTAKPVFKVTGTSTFLPKLFNLGLSNGTYGIELGAKATLDVDNYSLDLSGNNNGGIYVNDGDAILRVNNKITNKTEKYGVPTIIKTIGAVYQADSMTKETVESVDNYYLANDIYTVTISIDGTDTTKKVITGEKLVKPEDPEKEDYEFVGWYVGADEFDYEEAPNTNITITAKFNYIIHDATYSYVDGFSEEPIVDGKKVTFKDGEVKYYNKAINVGGGNRVGVIVKAPDNLTEVQYNAANVVVNYKINGVKTKYTEGTFAASRNTEDAIDVFGVWPLVTADLEEVEIIVTWADYKVEKFYMVFDNVSLEPASATFSYADGFSVTPTPADNKITFANGEVKYYAKPIAVGGGNRVGVTVKAPSNMTKAQYEAANVKVEYVVNGNKENHFSGTFVESQNAGDAENVFGVWPLVTDTLDKVIITVDWTETKQEVFEIEFGEGITYELSPSSAEYLGGFSVEPTVENGTYTFANGEVTYYEGDIDLSRPAANRVGIIVKAPTNISAAERNAASVVVNYSFKEGSDTSKESFTGNFIQAKNGNDPENGFGVWPEVTDDLAKVEIIVTWREGRTDTYNMVFGNGITLEAAPVAQP